MLVLSWLRPSVFGPTSGCINVYSLFVVCVTTSNAGPVRKLVNMQRVLLDIPERRVYSTSSRWRKIQILSYHSSIVLKENTDAFSMVDSSNCLSRTNDELHVTRGMIVYLPLRIRCRSPKPPVSDIVSYSPLEAHYSSQQPCQAR